MSAIRAVGPVVFLILIALGLSTQESAYGEPCSVNDIRQDGCDTSAFLHCDSFSTSSHSRSSSPAIGKCVCESTDMVYNETVSICVVFAEKSCRKNPNCIAHANCSIDHGLCKCDPGHRFHIGGVCLLWHHQPCSKDHECHVGAHLTCVDPEVRVGPGMTSSKVCECKPDSHAWSEGEETCVGLHGTQCLTILGEKCTGNAFCNSDQACECSEGYSPTPHHTCLRKHGSLCDNEALLCNHYNSLKCSEEGSSNVSRCECELPAMMQHQPEDDKCYVSLGESCQGRESGDWEVRMDWYDCVPNAQCEETTGQGPPPVCRCRAGYLDNGLGRCEESSSGAGGRSSFWMQISLALGGLALIKVTGGSDHYN